MDYRHLPRIANSDLSEFRNVLFGYPTLRADSPARRFGTVFHQFLLESAALEGLTPAQTRQAQAMRDSFGQDSFCRIVLEEAQAESVRVWDDKVTGLPCKARLDLWLAVWGLIVDVKTTSARSYDQFLADCLNYDYDRQAAFYLDSHPQAVNYVLVGVQKQKPYNLYYVEATARPGWIETGRKKYRALLRSWQQHNYRPTSWGPQPGVEVAAV